MYHPGTWFSDGRGSAGLAVGLDDLEGLFQADNSVISLWSLLGQKLISVLQCLPLLISQQLPELPASCWEEQTSRTGRAVSGWPPPYPPAHALPAPGESPACSQPGTALRRAGEGSSETSLGRAQPGAPVMWVVAMSQAMTLVGRPAPGQGTGAGGLGLLAELAACSLLKAPFCPGCLCFSLESFMFLVSQGAFSLWP